MGFSAGTETPLWVYNIRDNQWRKLRSKKGRDVLKFQYGLFDTFYNCCSGSSGCFCKFSSRVLHQAFLFTGVATPKGRRGHTALVYGNVMLVYGGYQDLKGSLGELWKYNFGINSY